MEQDRELSNDQKMKQCADEKDELTLTNPSLNVPLPENCRICYAPTGASGEDPVIQLGCQCKNDIGYGHQSCLTQWFRGQLLDISRRGIVQCEVCKNLVGAELHAIVRNSIDPEVMERMDAEILAAQTRFGLSRFRDHPEELRGLEYWDFLFASQI